MKKTLFIFFFGLLFLFTNAQQKKDSISIKNKKQHFISINIGGGAAWRKYYNNVSDNSILTDGIPQKGETPGPAYTFAVNYGYTKKRWTHTFGIEYDYATYQNNNAGRYSHTTSRDSTLIHYKYSMIHHFVSLSYSFNYTFGKKQNWRAGMNFKAGWLFRYTKNLKSSNNTPTYLVLDGEQDLGKNPTAWAGVFIGRKLVETKKLKLFVDLHANISSPVGYKTVIREVYRTIPGPFPGTLLYVDPPYDENFYQSKPHYLLITSLQFNLQFKL